MDEKKRAMKVFVIIFLVGVMVAGVAAWIFGGGNKKPRGEVKVDPTTAAIHELEQQIGTVAGETKKLGERTSDLESRTSALADRTQAFEENAKADREAVQKLAETVNRLADKVKGKASRADLAKKADKADLDKYALNGRVDMLEADVVAIKVAPSVTTVAQTRPAAGTITVKVRTVPVEPDEE